MKKLSLSLVAAAMLAAGATAQERGTSDQMSWLENEEIRFGADLTVGGSVTYMADIEKDENVINSHDWGRQVQMSHYSGPVPFQPEGVEMRESWKFIGWNPIQTGDCYGNRSEVLEHTNDGKTIYVKCRPMHWPLNNYPAHCTFETWYTIDGRTVHIRCRINNDRPDNTQYPARGQELPAVYTNGPWHRLMTYTGDAPFTGGEIVEIPKKGRTPSGMPNWANWLGTEAWAALVDEQDFGLGVWNPRVYRIKGGFAGKPGEGGPKDSPTGYIAPIRTEIIDHNIQYEYEYRLILDDLEGIREYIYENSEQPAPPRYAFDNSRRHWTYRNAHDQGWPIEGALQITTEKADAQLIGPAEAYAAKPEHKAIITIGVGSVDTDGGSARLHWTRLGEGGEQPSAAMDFEILPDGQVRSYTVPIGESADYTGLITGFRIDPFVPEDDGVTVTLESVVIE